MTRKNYWKDLKVKTMAMDMEQRLMDLMDPQVSMFMGLVQTTDMVVTMLMDMDILTLILTLSMDTDMVMQDTDMVIMELLD